LICEVIKRLFQRAIDIFGNALSVGFHNSLISWTDKKKPMEWPTPTAIGKSYPAVRKRTVPNMIFEAVST